MFARHGLELDHGEPFCTSCGDLLSVAHCEVCLTPLPVIHDPTGTMDYGRCVRGCCWNC